MNKTVNSMLETLTEGNKTSWKYPINYCTKYYFQLGTLRFIFLLLADLILPVEVSETQHPSKYIEK